MMGYIDKDGFIAFYIIWSHAWVALRDLRDWLD